MAINYADSAKQIVELIGGDSNVISVTHCATRLRFVLKEMGRVDKEVLKRVQGVITVIESSGQLQVVIGNHVGDAYRVSIHQDGVDGISSAGMG
ncbi:MULTISPECIES: PTS transporter subunit EIIB [Aeromonas]|uniref:PTS transporter subunit EIIB n=1 Tax=Aeromonas TaxID=642 RepID=UPI001C868FA9|nr:MULTISPECIES: PTS transporter subunit EIIB [Aeromonas]